VASAFDAFGGDVTVIELLEGVRLEEDQDVKGELARLLKCRSIDLRACARVGSSEVDQQPARRESGSGTMAGRMAIAGGIIVNQWRRIITARPSPGDALKGAVMHRRQLAIHKFNRRFDGNKQ
jgi:pyruvate/2-oxoglutarate dehydrogenase complex dihydrolipoamide dehydrogenase (E3) component